MMGLNRRDSWDEHIKIDLLIILILGCVGIRGELEKMKKLKMRGMRLEKERKVLTTKKL